MTSHIQSLDPPISKKIQMLLVESMHPHYKKQSIAFDNWLAKIWRISQKRKRVSLRTPGVTLVVLLFFCGSLNVVYGPAYLGAWTEVAMKKEMDKNAERGFTGMLGNIDYTH